jgi:hypothetical protein
MFLKIAFVPFTRIVMAFVPFEFWRRHLARKIGSRHPATPREQRHNTGATTRTP